MAQLIVETLDDEVDDNGLLSLREALAAANEDASSPDTITFASNLSDGEISLSLGQLVIDGALTIDGDLDDDGTPDISIDAEGNSRIFDVASGEVTLEGLTITGGDATGYDVDPSDIAGLARMGGAIRVLGGVALTIKDSAVTDNAAESGGAICVKDPSYNAELTIENSSIVDNTATYGSAVFSEQSKSLTVRDSIVSHNEAVYYGGIVVSSIDNVVLDGVTLTENTGNSAAALFVSNADSLSIRNSNISNNENTGATGQGVVLVYDAITDVYGTTFDSNTGRALDINGAQPASGSDKTLIVDSSTFSNNESSSNGGGIYLDESPNMQIVVVNSTFSQNKALKGAAIFVEDEGGPFLFLNHVTVVDNISTDDEARGAVESKYSSITYVTTIINSIFVNNQNGSSFPPGDEIIHDTAYRNNINQVPASEVFETIDPDTGTIVLADNGGPTKTAATTDAFLENQFPSAGGADFRGGLVVLPFWEDYLYPETDQRGVHRPMGAFADAGAYEADIPIIGHAPVLTVPDGMTFEATSQTSTTVTPPVTATDVEDGDLSSQVEFLDYYFFTDGAALTLGEHAFFAVVEDSDGNAVSKRFSITVVDTTPPVATSVPEMVYVANAGETFATSPVPEADDATWYDIFPIATRSVALETGPFPSGATEFDFPVGLTEVVYTATDENGNTGEASAFVTVVADKRPVLESVLRDTPPDEVTDADEVTFVASFDNPVVNVDAADFALTGALAGQSTITSVVGNGGDPDAGDSFEIVVDVPDLGNGTIGLDLTADPTIVSPLVDQPVEIVSGLPRETYTIYNNIAPEASDDTIVIDETSLLLASAAGTGITGNLITGLGGATADTDENGDQLTLSALSLDGTPIALGDPIDLGLDITLTIEADGSFLLFANNPCALHDLAETETLSIAIDETVSDGQLSDDAVARFTILGADEAGGCGGNAWNPFSQGRYIRGDNSDNFLLGCDGNNTIFGRGGNDAVIGCDGDDTVYGNGGDDLVYGGAGADKLNGGSGEDELHGGDGEDVVTGGRGSDTLFGDSGRDTLFGGAQNDQLTGGEDNDTIFGGGGVDTAFFAGNFADYTVTSGFYAKTITDTVTSDGDDGTDMLFGVEFAEFADGVFDLNLGTFTPDLLV